MVNPQGSSRRSPLRHEAPCIPGGAKARRPSSTPIGDGVPWAVATMPLAFALANRALDGPIPGHAGPAILVETALYLVVHGSDVRRLRARSAATRAALGRSPLIVPLYLWRRNALLGRPQFTVMAWCFALCAALAINPTRLRFVHDAAPGVPACGSVAVVAILPSSAAQAGAAGMRVVGEPVEIGVMNTSGRECIASLSSGASAVLDRYLVRREGERVTIESHLAQAWMPGAQGTNPASRSSSSVGP